MAISAAIQNKILALGVGTFGFATGADYLSSFAGYFESVQSQYGLSDDEAMAWLAHALVSSPTFQAQLAGKVTAEAQAEVILANFGLEGDAALLATTVAAIDAFPADPYDASVAMSQLILGYTIALSAGGEAVATYPDAAALLANKVIAAEYYSVEKGQSSDDVDVLKGVLANITGGMDEAAIKTAVDNADTEGNEAGVDFVLTTAQDVRTGTSGDDFYRGVAGLNIGAQDQTTLNSSDIIDGAGGNDSLIVNMTGNLYQGGARIKNIETLKIGTDIAAATFDYNVNAGFNEISDTLTIVADQINGGEVLTVNNVLKTDTDGDSTRDTLPTLSWENDSNTDLAGVVAYNYRAAEVVGATTQAINLSNVHNGDLNIDGGIETFNVTSVGSQNTLRSGTNAATGNDNADLSSGGNLSTVNITATAEFGKAAGIIAASGLTDRQVGSDEGIGADASAADVNTSTGSNLVSVEDNVATVNAADSTAAVNIRFVKDVAAGRNVTFTGGAGNDYVEFELGNVNANGGAGDDIFSFINGDANSTFGESDSINGGEGSDTIQIGLNGNAQTYNISETELRNKESVGTLDLRGQTTNLTLSSDFVSKADTADSITIRTDKIIQVSATDPLNGSATTPVTGFALEDNSTHTVNLSKLSSNQSVNYMGGSGSDRIILNDATFNVLKTIDGGNYTQGTGGSNFVAGSNRYDTITLITNGENVVVDAQDLSNVKDVEGFVLTKNAAQATYNITLTSAFLNANTESIDNATNTAIDDRVFQIGTTAAANNSALGTGDIVNIDYTSISGVTGRFVDIQSLVASGATVNLINNGVTTLHAQNGVVVTALPAVMNGNNAIGRADVIGASPAIPAGQVQLVFTGTSGDTTSGFEILGNKVATSGNDNIVVNGLVLTAAAVINGSTGTDTLTATTGADIAVAAVTSVETLSLTGEMTMSQGQHAAFTTINGTTAADEINVGVAGAFTTAASIETYDFVAGGIGGGNITGTSTGAGGQTFNVGTHFTNADTLTGGAGTADVMRTDVAGGTAVTDIDNVSGVETIVLSNAAGVYAWTPTNASSFDNDTTAVTFNATALTTGTLALDLTNVDGRGLTVNLNNAGTGADVITVDTTVANVARAHTVSGLGVGDTINMTTNGAAVYTVDLATFDAATFQGDVNAKLAAINYSATDAAGDIILARIGGSNNDVYAVVVAATGGVATTDEVIHIVGTQAIALDGALFV